MKVRSGIAGAVVAVLTAAWWGTALFVASRLVSQKRRPRRIKARYRADGIVELPPTPEALAPGEYGIWLDGGGHLAIGEVVGSDRTKVLRSARGSDASLGTRGDLHGKWTSQSLSSPSSVGKYTDVLVSLGGEDAAAAWDIKPNGDRSDRWTIHVHGLRSSRFGALRSALPTHAAGWRSLIISIAGDDECSTRVGEPSTLGTLEWQEVESAVKFALSHGAQRIVLIGWSMGASAILQLLQHSGLARTIDGVVLIAPALNWEAIVRNALRSAQLPRAMFGTVSRVLRSRIWGRILGLSVSVDLDSLSWASTSPDWACLPTLILHSTADDVVPYESSRQFASGRRRTEVVTFQSQGHANEFNENTEQFCSAIQSWLEHLTDRPRQS